MLSITFGVKMQVNFKFDISLRVVTFIFDVFRKKPRPVGPLDIIGPSISAITGQPLIMSHVVACNDTSDDAFHFMTWGDGQVFVF
jgi:hypothetical protein